MDYRGFLEAKAQAGEGMGFEPVWMPEFLFGFQRALVEWAVRMGRGAVFADCGLGKTPMQLVWAENVVRKTNRPVLILTPLAVSRQTVEEAAKFGIEVYRSGDGKVHPGINITNYERLHYFNPDDFSGCVCDESSILKSFDGTRRGEITEFMRRMEYRLLCTATAAPNDYIELGTSSEALGQLGYMDMLSRFFKNDQNTIKPMVYRHRGQSFQTLDDAAKWRFKGHAEVPFWQWVCSWARACRRPSDLGFADDGFILPPLIEHDHLVEAKKIAEGYLFSLPAVGLAEQREERRRTIRERCEKVAELVDAHESSMIWCALNEEGDLLEELIPRAIQVAGKHSDDYKEAASEWFVGRKCLCNDPMFSAKLRAWTKSSDQTPNTCARTIAQTSIDGHAVERQETGSMRGAENATRMIQTNAGGKSKKSKNTGSNTQRRGCGAPSSVLESASSNIANSLHKDAPSAADKQTSISGASKDFTSTIATLPGNSEDYSVHHAISGSGNSGMTRSGLSRPRCICGHEDGRRRLISKPTIFGYGLNFQHCAHVTFFPSHSFEQYYQGVRRCWRFGQKRPVRVDVVTTEGEKTVLANLQRKAVAADRMFSNLVEHMNAAISIDRGVTFKNKEEIPAWL